MNYKKIKEGIKTEMSISSQITLNDKNWKIVKKFRFVENNKYKYTYLIECSKCGYKKEVSTSGIYKKYIKCPNCFCTDEIGKIYGCYKITKFVGYNNNKERLYDSVCLKCDHIFKSRRIGDIKKSLKESCHFCKAINDNFAYNYLLAEYKTGAKDRNLSFELNKEDFLSIINKPCIYCGAAP